jgi:hypothetical protein
MMSSNIYFLSIAKNIDLSLMYDLTLMLKPLLKLTTYFMLTPWFKAIFENLKTFETVNKLFVVCGIVRCNLRFQRAHL